MKKIDSKDLIVKSNYLLESPCKLTISEQKVIYMVLKMIDKDEDDFKEYEFFIADFINMLELKGQSAYTELKSITRLLRSRTFTVRFYDTKQDQLSGGITEIQTGWVSDIVYKRGEGKILFSISKYLKPFLLDLKENFTKLDFNNLKQLKSIYSTHIYELLKQYEKIGQRTFEIEQLRYHLSIQEHEYPKYSNLKQKVLLVAQKELSQKTDIFFEFEEIKRNRRVVAIKFIIHTKTPQIIDTGGQLSLIGHVSHSTLPALPECEESTEDQIESIKKKVESTINAKIGVASITKLIHEAGTERIEYYLKHWDKFKATSKGNVAGFFIKAVLEQYDLPCTKLGENPNELSNRNNFDQRNYEEENLDIYYSNV